jgi:TolB protein
LLILAVGWLAAPRASQPGANDGFLLFVTDRDDPSEDGICATCEDIYVMYPDGSEPIRLTKNEASDNGPVWSHRVKTVAFHSNRSGPPEIS